MKEEIAQLKKDSLTNPHKQCEEMIALLKS